MVSNLIYDLRLHKLFTLLFYVYVVKKKPTYDEIMGRCDSIIKKALDAKLEQKLQNKNPIAVCLTHLLLKGRKYMSNIS